MKETECFGEWINTPFGPEGPRWWPRGLPCKPGTGALYPTDRGVEKWGGA